MKKEFIYFICQVACVVVVILSAISTCILVSMCNMATKDLREAKEEMVTLKQDVIEYSREVVKCKNMYEELYEAQEKGYVK